MRRFNKWMNDQLPPRAWDAYAGIAGLGAITPRGGLKGNTIELGGMTVAEFESRRPPGVSPAQWEALKGVMDSPRGGSERLQFWVLSGLCSQGIRVFAPDDASYTALGYTDVNVPWELYRQPYPVFCVVVPDSWSGPLEADLGRPVFMVGRHHPTERVVTWMAFGDSGQFTNLFWYATYTDDAVARGETIESRLRLRYDRERQFKEGTFADPPGPFDIPMTERETAFFEHATRAFFNANLLLTNYGHRDAGPTNPEYMEHLLRSLKKKNLPDAARKSCETERKRMPRVVTFDQTVTLWKGDRPPAGEPGDGGGWKVKPHWRRGHLAKQRHGPGRELVKFVFRPAVFVNADAFGGDAAKLRTTYQE